MSYKFIDLFAGIGGFRIGMERAGFECVFSSEIDEHACKMYEANFKEDPYCDITKLDPNDIPEFDVLVGGFPCQAFSISGKQKGFYDKTRGTLFFDILRILDKKKPKAFILENVKNLETHDKGRTMTIIIDSLTDLGYTVTYRVLNAKDFGVPQNRERVIIVGSLEGKYFTFDNLEKNPVHSMKDFLDSTGEFEYLKEDEYTLIDKKYVKRQASDLIFVGYRNKKLRRVGVREGTEHLSRVHKQPNRIYSIEGVHPTFSAQEMSGRYFIYDGKSVRKLTIDECYRFMGFPEDFIKIGPIGKLYERIGNSICVNMVESLAKELKNMLDNDINSNDPNQILEQLYSEAQLKDITKKYPLDDEKKQWVNTIVNYEETFKGVYTVLITSLVYKLIHPEQDVRLHKKSLPNGYSGRSFDTKYVTPFLKRKRFLGAMKESGWLTRSLEQNHPFDLDFPGRINSKEVKNAFLNILNDIEVFKSDPKPYIINIMAKSIEEKARKTVVLINPVEKESKLSINEIMSILEQHFNERYTSRGASILPVVAFYAIYKCLIDELVRYQGKKLDKLASHYSSDKSSKNAGDIVVRNPDDSLYEVVEIKFDREIDLYTIDDAYNKIKPTTIQRYYILSTIDPTLEDRKVFKNMTDQILEEHGCQVIINGLMKTLNYYLRLIKDTDVFIKYYIEGLNEHPEINHEHLIAWNRLFKID
jgi:DNA (cytosine-5)-methyltransferase 1